MPSESATAQACWPPAPPNVVSAYSVTSWPFSTEIRFTALAMFATATCRYPSATCSGVRSSPVCSPHLGGQLGEPPAHDLDVERLVAVGTEHVGEVRRAGCGRA